MPIRNIGTMRNYAEAFEESYLECHMQFFWDETYFGFQKQLLLYFSLNNICLNKCEFYLLKASAIFIIAELLLPHPTDDENIMQ